MIHYTIGNVGHFLVIVSFILSLVSSFSFFRSVTAKAEHLQKGHLSDGRLLFFVHSGAVLAVIIVLLLIIYNNYFEYHYAYTHASRLLPVHFMISCFWEGQEGSFLLWIFWNCALGLGTDSHQQEMAGSHDDGIHACTGFSGFHDTGYCRFQCQNRQLSIFAIARCHRDPIFEINPEFIPADGTGLNPLLQNYWMVIHPPVLFLGYATTLIPFAYLMAGLWTKKYAEWIQTRTSMDGILNRHACSRSVNGRLLGL